MNVADPRSPQPFRQDRPIELRVVSRSGNSAHVYDTLYAVRPQQLEKLFPRARGMSNRQDIKHVGFTWPRQTWMASADQARTERPLSCLKEHQELCVDSKFHSGSGVPPRFMARAYFCSFVSHVSALLACHAIVSRKALSSSASTSWGTHWSKTSNCPGESSTVRSGSRRRM